MKPVVVFEPHTIVLLGLKTLFSKIDVPLLGAFSECEPFLSALREAPPGTVALIGIETVDESIHRMMDAIKVEAQHVRTLMMTPMPTPAVKSFLSRWSIHGAVNSNTRYPLELVTALGVVAAGDTWFPDAVADGAPPGLWQLSVREREVLLHVADGHDNLKIAGSLGITERTVKAHVSRIYRKLNLENRIEIALVALENGFSRQLN